LLGVSELIPVLGSQPAGDVNHKPGGIAAITFRQARSFYVAVELVKCYYTQQLFCSSNDDILQ